MKESDQGYKVEGRKPQKYVSSGNMVSRKSKCDQRYNAPKDLHGVNPEEIDAKFHVGENINSTDQYIEVAKGYDQPSLLEASLLTGWRWMPEVYEFHDSKPDMASSKGTSYIEEYGSWENIGRNPKKIN